MFGPLVAERTLEETFLDFQKEFQFLHTSSILAKVLPEGVLREQHIALFTKTELESELRAKTGELEEANRALAKEISELRESKETLERLQQGQGDFVNVVSHQFRTPLSAIRWSAEYLGEMAGQSDQRSVRRETEAVNAIRDRVIYLLMTLNSVFDLVTIESGRLRLNKRTMPLLGIFIDAIGGQKSLIERKGIALVLDHEHAAQNAIPVDPDLIRRVLDIVFTNAVNYTPQGGMVSASLLEETQEGKPFLHGIIQDNGIGIHEEDLPKVFDKFFRGRNASTTAPDGAGISLFIAKHVTEMHGGKIWLESPGIGKGTTVHLLLSKE